MALVPKRRERQDPMTAFRRRFDDLFEDFFGSLPAERGEFGLLGEFPAVDVRETDDSVEVSAEVPGMEADDLDVDVREDVLSIRGEKEEKNEDKQKRSYRVERRYGSFERTVPLPAEVDVEKASADCKEGVLTVHLPKKAEKESKRRKIRIK